MDAIVHKQEVSSDMDNKCELMKKLQSYNFAAYDMLLYLDTHPDDRKAFSLFQDLIENTKKFKAEYEKNYGALTPFSSAAFESFDWLNSPWPWEKEANK